ncbi:tyrosine-type recombinase/integrase [Algoriphagus halophilus]|uniref:tyrosine-type recombinase/integrase n=1 Tax=Algoriphagus halophilus TaxID=226505 RepID=UPI00358F85B7
MAREKKDRYVPLSDLLIRGIKTYPTKPNSPLSGCSIAKGEQIIGRAGGDFDGRYSRGVQWAVNEAKKKARHHKPMNVHTLRHRIHLLEEGLDILTIKDLLGHECIDTMILHVAQTRKMPCL